MKDLDSSVSTLPPHPNSQFQKIAAALAKAQSEFVSPEKNKTVTVKDQLGKPLYSFDYADYHAIVEAVRGPLTKNEICYTHLVEVFGTTCRLVTKLIHSSGQELSTIYPLPDPGRDPKGFGGAMTYGKRYSLSAITGCVADDDVDENPKDTVEFKDKAPKAPASPPKIPTPNQTPPKPELISDAQRVRMFAIASEKGWTESQIKEYLEFRYHITSSKQLNRAQYDEFTQLMQESNFEHVMANHWRKD
jgi:hypothetical protein